MPELAKKKRIFQIAKELNISHLEIIQFLASNGMPANSHMAPVTPEVYDAILLEFSKDKLQIERHRKEQARKVVVSKIQQTHPEETKTASKTKQPAVRKLKTSLKDEKLELSDKLKDASSKLVEAKKKATLIDKNLDVKSSVSKPEINDIVKASKKEVENIEQAINYFKSKQAIALGDIVPGAGHNNTRTAWLYTNQKELVELVEKQPGVAPEKRLTIK